ncbi:MAG: transposase [Sphingomonadales bacterium]|nr:transposase [Sphingomonadales bacterium]MDE2170851.1 transposase [Sphingomonadales bacterium]
MLAEIVLIVCDFRIPLVDRGTALPAYPPELAHQLLDETRRSPECQLLMSIPGVGATTTTSCLTAVEDPVNVTRTRSVGAWL